MIDDATTFVEPEIIHGDAHDLPVPDASVDLVITSPPYFGLRTYRDSDTAYRGQLGAEDTPSAYLENLIACTREMIRALKPSGSIFINLGDKYSGHTKGSGTGRASSGTRSATRVPDGGNPHSYAVPAKSLIGLPWRYALRCIDDLGLILRAEIIWSKPHGLPESVRDRVRRSHETWFHFTLNPRYYSALDTIRLPHSASSLARVAPHRSDPGRAARDGRYYPGAEQQTLKRRQMLHPHGRLPGSVWEIAPQPLRVPPHLGIAHHASFPVEWPRRLVLGWSPRRVCTACGHGRRRVPVAFGLDTSRPQTRRALELVREHGLTEAHLSALRAAGLSDTPRALDTQGRTAVPEHPGRELVVEARTALGGYAREFLLSRATEFADACDCADTSAASVPGVVLDPFGGTGTTALAAAVHGRRAISLDASRDYCRLATWRVHDPRQQARARGTHQAPEPVSRAA
ncbi:DNA modification methylase [Saccharomonospora marina XMU15]|uniref:Methyltransferase n=1 Tax=Saccharomonospora marina XMU15 TaxID=882083 RepID=H5X5X3_9PSEU|nr:site-specific DNA-methyltransferase [Saccharomonospora marina]EHR52327.1 DNA modification methylase [Saccharomonospora marina XMU15]